MATTQGIKLDDKTLSRLKALAEKKSRSSHWLMRTAIEKYLDHEEHYENERSDDMARWNRYLTTGNAVDGETVENWLTELTQNKETSWPK
ncbi:ribbon-helix-helix protein, CopG family [Candidatus Saccharibacteria bacterium]|nr:ribbon-helix-helix protein, CopG family [Candidatus Saccharibacteria bacterium]